MHINKKFIMEPPPMQYAGFWRRLLAGLLEFIIVGIPLFSAHYYSWYISKNLFVFMQLGAPMLLTLMDLYLLTRFGGTIGKLLVGIRVVKINGDKININNALLRNSVDILYTVISIAIFMAILDRIDYRIVSSLHGKQLGDYWQKVYPSWNYILRYINTIYGTSEAFVMLTNNKRRAIHDFIAGTIVIIRPKTI